ncbi:MAG: 3-deoxy-D-manno-octulosonic acid transferase [candidate division Zixibacteria bacterium]|nr:3-deoxy-D-manno-octulosonic acid transferase [candidate division Zixibacteria bacterium]
MGFRIYDILMTIAAIVSSPVLLYLGYIKGHRVRERLGIYNGRLNRFLNGKRPVWFHAASVGEVRVLAALIPSYIRTSHEKKIVVSTVTRTGWETAEKILPKECLPIYAPVDLKVFVRRAFKRINPKVLVIAETEFWPNMIKVVNEGGVKIYCINGRISQKSYPRYKFIKHFFKQVLSRIEYFFMQSEADAERIIKLGVDKSKVVVPGNIKYDLKRTDNKIKKSFKVSQCPDWINGDRIIVAGSTHRGEEKSVIDAFVRLKKVHEKTILILAPRHLSRLEEVKSLVDTVNLEMVLKSSLDNDNGNARVNPGSVVILDTMGELQYIYNWGEAAFVGGSLDKTGGHNPLEPAACSVPIAFGPNMQNCHEISEMLLKAGGAVTVRNSEELYEFFNDILSNSENARLMGESAAAVAHKNNGVSDNVAELLFDHISHNRNNVQPQTSSK